MRPVRDHQLAARDAEGVGRQRDVRCRARQIHLADDQGRRRDQLEAGSVLRADLGVIDLVPGTGRPRQRRRADLVQQSEGHAGRTMANDEGVKAYFAFMKQYMPNADLSNSNYAAGYHYANLMVKVLIACKDDFSRANIMKQAASMRDVRLPLLLPALRCRPMRGLSAVPAVAAAPLRRQELGRLRRDSGRPLGRRVPAVQEEI